MENPSDKRKMKEKISHTHTKREIDTQCENRVP